MANFKLIMLPNPIVVSDEEIKEGDWFLPISGIGWKLNVPVQADGKGGYNNNHCKKIIAGIPELPSIDFSGLTEEECKRIGWVDVEKLANDWYESLFNDFERVEGKDKIIDLKRIDSITKFKKGFKTAESLNEKKFSEDDLKNALFAMYLLTIKMTDKSGTKLFEDTGYEKIIQSLSQPKVFDVELELRDVDEVYLELQQKHGDYLNYHFHYYDSGRKTIKKEFEHLYLTPKITKVL